MPALAILALPVSTFVVVKLVVLGGYARGARHVVRLLRKPELARHGRMHTGIIFVAFVALMIWSVPGNFAAGLLVGPSMLGLFIDAQSISYFSELGVVMFLFVIGLELRPRKLWAMRDQIFGLGLLQVGLAIAALALTGAANFELSAPAAQVPRFDRAFRVQRHSFAPRRTIASLIEVTSTPPAAAMP